MAVSMSVDMINFSYGEASHWTSKGLVINIGLCILINTRIWPITVCYSLEFVFISHSAQ